MSENQEPPEVEKPIPVRKSSAKKSKKKILCSWASAEKKSQRCDFEAADENQMITHVRHAHRGKEYEPPEDEEDEEGEDEEQEPPRILTAAEVAANAREAREAKRLAREKLLNPRGKTALTPAAETPRTTVAEIQAALAKQPETDLLALKKMKDVLYLLAKLEQTGMRLSDEQKAWLQITSTILGT